MALVIRAGVEEDGKIIWRGGAAAMFAALNYIVNRGGNAPEKDWPRNEKSLGIKLMGLSQILAQGGIAYDKIHRNTGSYYEIGLSQKVASDIAKAAAMSGCEIPTFTAEELKRLTPITSKTEESEKKQAENESEEQVF